MPPKRMTKKQREEAKRKAQIASAATAVATTIINRSRAATVPVTQASDEPEDDTIALNRAPNAESQVSARVASPTPGSSNLDAQTQAQVEQMISDAVGAQALDGLEDGEERYNWLDPAMTGVLLASLQASIAKGWITKNNWRSQVFADVRDEFRSRGFRLPTNQQIRNRRDVLKRNWQELRKLLNITGGKYRYNAASRMVEADLEVWETAPANEAKWQGASVMWKDELDEIFGGRVAEGRFASGRQPASNIDLALRDNVAGSGIGEESEVGDALTQQTDRTTPSRKREASSMTSPRQSRSDLSELVSILKTKLEQEGNASKLQASDRRMALRQINDVAIDAGWTNERRRRAWKLVDSEVNVDIVIEASAEDLIAWLEDNVEE